MTRPLAIALLAATLSAQTNLNSGERREFLNRPGNRTLTDDSVGLNRPVRRRGRTLLAAQCWRLAGALPLRNTTEQFGQEADQGLPAFTTIQSFDGNGALEAFYLQKPEKTYYWYSLQQENAMCDIAESNGRPCVRKTIRVSGINRPYTEITHAKRPWGYWPDYRLVTVVKGGAN